MCIAFSAPMGSSKSENWIIQSKNVYVEQDVNFSISTVVLSASLIVCWHLIRSNTKDSEFESCWTHKSNYLSDNLIFSFNIENLLRSCSNISHFLTFWQLVWHQWHTHKKIKIREWYAGNLCYFHFQDTQMLIVLYKHRIDKILCLRM